MLDVGCAQRLAWFLALSACVNACKARPPHALLADKLCASVCADAALGAHADPSRSASLRECSEACELERAQAARFACAPEFDADLACLGRAELPTQNQSSPLELFTLGPANGSCAGERAAYTRCAAPCRERGVTRSAADHVRRGARELFVQAEAVSAGCGPGEPAPLRKSNPGAACEHESVCSSFRCACAGSAAAFLARACVDGHCASAQTACDVVPSALAANPCSGQ